MDKGILRIIDANYNRVLEGIRVCEEITRFVLSARLLTASFKYTRHTIVATMKKWHIQKHALLDSRNSQNDVGKPSARAELTRLDYKDIFYANIQRSKESVRVLEECAKLNNKAIARLFKDIRYRLYEIEKKTHSKL
ncbi:MAG: hypothetical protein A2Y00_03940 [Omnitrophica WOR_2 bacterium GWF2_43_52]|nr:MAG: hypothetical protein A2062_01810 [Omnitrophica WOR_2 bacterium GWA2_44_7]OGX15025.1 MAG: hypothetical protein A2Y01_02210 [Omnitrophica WOR_2 bacterium GWC2_44_8]OGX22583.1 MAG: hypothetical protein A2Y00_03940 [Omnitrophica WOR_2 bacterium GWF2_43_52]OGX53780.1 MAG: hypothetical protein A2460_06825 [Omnitrophica WOR_2 bacterium RIFOXYC2_FULL_43_9]HAH21412.1 thiamine-phosphate pyrophosphorylase [Candidatus Omnitrophota bacterium]